MSDVLPRQFDPVLHSGPRITIMSRLVIHQRMRFADLRDSTTLSGGNLASHLQVLGRAGYLVQDVDDRKVVRQKMVRVTPTGDAAFRAYVGAVRQAMEGLDAALKAAVPGDP
jgi:DNA-binding MarR family transcriptional regulator